MTYIYDIIIALWLFWAAFWKISANYSEKSTQTETTVSRLTHLILLTCAGALLALPVFGNGFLGQQLLPGHHIDLIIGAVLVTLGLGFAIWARTHLGQYWSGAVGLKSEHRVITSGPYAFVRHPIYTGLLLAFLGTALAEDQISGLFAIVLASIACIRKLRIEETLLVHQLGEEYQTYQHRVKALIPFLW
jgi:protein-S-isoprenylcysteine O-methyltransferase Ste14